MGAVSDFLNAQLGGGETQRVGIAGFTLLARVRDSYKYSSEVPTTYLEDGSSVEDHIVLNPVTLSIEGEVSDVFVEQSALQQLSRQAATQVGGISIFLPERTQSQRQAVAQINAAVNDAVALADEIVNTGGQVASLFGSANLEGKSLRERFVDTMESLHYGKQLVDIQMPYRTFSNMRLTVDISSDNQRDILTFKIEAAQVRTADEAVSSVDPSLLRNPSSGLNGQADEITDKGVQEGEDVQESLASTVLGLFGG